MIDICGHQSSTHLPLLSRSQLRSCLDSLTGISYSYPDESVSKMRVSRIFRFRILRTRITYDAENYWERLEMDVTRRRNEE